MSIELKLSLDGRGAIATLPGGHSLQVPLNEQTGAVLESILIAQQSSPGAKVGSRAAPLQEMVREFLAKGGQVRKLKPVGAAARGAAPAAVDISLEELFDLPAAAE